MPLQRAQTGDTVTYRKATSKKSENAYVRGGQPPTPSAPTLTTFNTGGSLSDGTYTYRYTDTITAEGVESAPSATEQIVVDAGGSSNRVVVTFPDGAITGVSRNVYGRTGTQLLIAAATTATYNDTGSVTPSGAAPADSGRAKVYIQSTRAEFDDIIPGLTGGTYAKHHPNAPTV